jgi:hypothetical protein
LQEPVRFHSSGELGQELGPVLDVFDNFAAEQSVDLRDEGGVERGGYSDGEPSPGDCGIDVEPMRMPASLVHTEDRGSVRTTHVEEGSTGAASGVVIEPLKVRSMAVEVVFEADVSFVSIEVGLGVLRRSADSGVAIAAITPVPVGRVRGGERSLGRVSTDPADHFSILPIGCSRTCSSQ